VDLSRLTETQKDALILEQQAKIISLEKTVAELHALVIQLQETIKVLQARLDADSHNSNKPPSTNGFRKPPKPKSLREKSGKKSGGQPGNPGKTLLCVENPDHIVSHAPPILCDSCSAILPKATIAETRQVFDLPVIRYEVTEHQLLQTQCQCGKLHRGTFPDDVSGPVQYGPRALATAVYLTNQQMMPLQRTTEVFNDLFALPISESTVVTACLKAEARLQPTVSAIAASLEAVPVAHADETGCKIGGSLHWMHVLVTQSLTWIGVHKKRGAEAMNAFGILSSFSGTLVHDGWESYRALACQHALCNAHHLRELIACFEQGQAWAGRMIELLRAGCHEVNKSARGILSKSRRTWYVSEYQKIIRAGFRKHPYVASSGKRGRTAQSKATNLLGRLCNYADDVWRFASDPAVPFTNNLAEQAVRMPKVKQKISGGFRTKAGAENFCVIRSYIATMRKQGVNVFSALTSTFQGTVPQPCFS
jgi:transposase